LSYHAKTDDFRATERRGVEALLKELKRGKFLHDLWTEYEDFKENKTRPGAVVKFADGLDAWMQGIVTRSTWWPAWEQYNQKTFAALSCSYPDLAAMFRRVCDMARDPNVQVWLPDALDEECDLWNLVRFLKGIYSLKELPRHGFTMFGMKRSETDTFAEHGFTTASLALLVAAEILDQREMDLYRTVMLALSHDLPVAVTGDAAYDLQLHAGDAWREMSTNALDALLGEVSWREEISTLHASWLRCADHGSLTVKAAAAVDAWEVGVTTPTAWIGAWIDYSDKALAVLQAAPSDVGSRLAQFLADARRALGSFSDRSLDDEGPVGREPEIMPIRLGGDGRRTMQSS
jgi:5'-deoxynucleotidase YfbR-like HD superfamily hydrolase